MPGVDWIDAERTDCDSITRFPLSMRPRERNYPRSLSKLKETTSESTIKSLKLISHGRNSRIVDIIIPRKSFSLRTKKIGLNFEV